MCLPAFTLLTSLATPPPPLMNISRVSQLELAKVNVLDFRSLQYRLVFWVELHRLNAIFLVNLAPRHAEGILIIIIILQWLILVMSYCIQCSIQMLQIYADSSVSIVFGLLRSPLYWLNQNDFLAVIVSINRTSVIHIDVRGVLMKQLGTKLFSWVLKNYPSAKWQLNAGEIFIFIWSKTSRHEVSTPFEDQYNKGESFWDTICLQRTKPSDNNQIMTKKQRKSLFKIKRELLPGNTQG